MARYARVYQNSELVQVRKHRAYEVQVLREAFHLHGSEPGDVAARMSKIGGDAIFGRVVLIKTHHDRDGAGGFGGRQNRWRARCEYDADFQPDELARQFGEARVVSVGKSSFDGKVFSFDIAELAHTDGESRIDAGIELRRPSRWR